MPRNKSSYLEELSTSDLKKLLAARERIDVLEQEKADLLKKLAGIEIELEKLVTGLDKRSVGRPRTVGKVGAGKVVKKAAKKVAKKAARKTTTKVGKKVAKKAVKKVAKKSTGKVGRPRGTTKKLAKKSVKKTTRVGRGKVSLVDVVVGVLEQAGRPLPFKEILETIKSGKLYRTKSKSFDNLLRKTLSSSERFARAGRGIYTLA